MSELFLELGDCFANNKKLRELTEDRLVIYTKDVIGISQYKDALVVKVNGCFVAEFYSPIIGVSMTIENKS